MIGITKEGQLIEIEDSSPLAGVQLIGVLVNNPSDLSSNHLNIANHFYSKDFQQLRELSLHVLHTNQSLPQQKSEQS